MGNGGGVLETITLCGNIGKGAAGSEPGCGNGERIGARSSSCAGNGNGGAPLE
jgi:hypothetical protein